MKFIISLVLTYYFVSIVQTIFHRIFGHKNRIHHIFVTHALGHHSKYKPNTLLSKDWINSEQHVMWYYTIPIAPVFFFIAWLFSWPVTFGFTVGLVFSIWWHIYLHEQYHIDGSFFEKYKWFLKKRLFHFDHHRCVTSNYAIVETWLDLLMGTKYSIEKEN